MRLREAERLKIGDLVIAPKAGLYAPTKVLGKQTDEDPRVKLLISVEATGSERWYNYRFFRKPEEE